MNSAPTSTARWRQASIALAVASLLCLGAGIALPLGAGRLLHGRLAQLLPISPGSAAYSSWLSTEMRFQVWMWNVTNVGAVLDLGAAPQLSQVGPFTFRETRTREGVKFHANNTVEYRDVRTYYFLVEESVGRMADFEITNVNLPYIGVALRSRGMTPFTKKIVRNILLAQSGPLFVTRNAEELLMGYDDAGMLGLRAVMRLTGMGAAPPTRFGIMLGKNATAKGTALVGTGAAGLDDLHRIHLWNGRPHLANLWRQDWANQVVGTDGTMFPPPVTPAQSLLVFTPDLCRSANMTFTRPSNVHGIPVLAFSPATSAMLNVSLRPQNAAFCTPRCLDSGVLNLSRCLAGQPPVVASAPHFRGAPAYAAGVRGVWPLANDGREFETLMEVEPNTGLMLRAARRMQINIGLEPVAGFPDTERFQPLHLMPYLWLNESGSIGRQPAHRFKQRVLWPLRLASLISWLLLALGLAVAAVASVVGFLALRLRPSASRQRRWSGPARAERTGSAAAAAAKEAAAMAAVAAAVAAETHFVRPYKSDSRLGQQQQQQQQDKQEQQLNDFEFDLVPFLPETPIV